jgi:hypothetical protein
MHLNRSLFVRAALLISLMANLTILSNSIKADTGSCGGATTTLPFTDVQGNLFFCQIAAAYFSGLTAGTSATTYSPSQNVNREQMAAFTTRTLDQALKRGSRKAVTKKWWTPQNGNSLSLTPVGDVPAAVEFDGTDLWVANFVDATVIKVRASDGKLLDTWTGANGASAILCAMGKIFIAGSNNRLYMIDPTQPAGEVATVTTFLGTGARGIAFDGSRIWTANSGSSVSIVSLNPTTVTSIRLGFQTPAAILYDGSHIWVTDIAANKLHKLNSDGSIAQTIDPVFSAYDMAFDGTNIWALGYEGNSITVVRVKDAQGNPLPAAFRLVILTGNGMDFPIGMAFDGERILVTNTDGNSVSLWKAADLTPLGSFSTGAGSNPHRVCSDGLNFWITLLGSDSLARF